MRISTNHQEKIRPADGHVAEWRIATMIGNDLHPYILNAVANGWEKIYGLEWKNHVTDEAAAIIGNPRDFIPLRYHPINVAHKLRID